MMPRSHRDERHIDYPNAAFRKVIMHLTHPAKCGIMLLYGASANIIAHSKGGGVMADNLTFTTIAAHFSNEDEAYKLIERIRWPNGPTCPHCGSVDHAYYLEPQDGPRQTRKGTETHRRLWKCADCRKQFSVLIGTIFEDSHLPLHKWLMAIHEMCAAKNGISALELSRKLGIAYRSAWFMNHRIRHAMTQSPLADMLQGTVEADETYVGGKAKGKRGRGAANKTPVFTLVERGGEARSRTMQHVTSANVGAVLNQQVDTTANLMTDSYQVYNVPGKEFATHQTVNHGAGEYVRGDVYSNTVEGFFSQLKRSLDGTFHHVSAQHLDRYLSEFDFRYSTRKLKDSERTLEAIKRTSGKRLRYYAGKSELEPHLT